MAKTSSLWKKSILEIDYRFSEMFFLLNIKSRFENSWLENVFFSRHNKIIGALNP